MNIGFDTAKSGLPKETYIPSSKKLCTSKQPKTNVRRFVGFGGTRAWPAVVPRLRSASHGYETPWKSIRKSSLRPEGNTGFFSLPFACAFTKRKSRHARNPGPVSAVEIYTWYIHHLFAAGPANCFSDKHPASGAPLKRSVGRQQGPAEKQYSDKYCWYVYQVLVSAHRKRTPSVSQRNISHSPRRANTASTNERACIRNAG